MPVKKILIVDDEVGMLESLERKLEADGFEVILATNGQEAAERIFSYTPDLVFMDIVLPDIEGSEIVRRLQSDPVARKIPIVFLSGIVASGTDSRQSQVKVGGWEYRALAKPFTYRDLREMIDDVFSG
jgi:CheY-like chemotaxis protein